MDPHTPGAGVFIFGRRFRSVCVRLDNIRPAQCAYSVWPDRFVTCDNYQRNDMAAGWLQSLAASELAAEMEVALITAGGMLIAAALGFFFKSISGENRASVRKMYTEAITNDANAANTYMEAARGAAVMMSELQKKVTDLTARVETLEAERSELEEKVSQLQAENKLLRSVLDVRGLKLP